MDDGTRSLVHAISLDILALDASQYLEAAMRNPGVRQIAWNA